MSQKKLKRNFYGFENTNTLKWNVFIKSLSKISKNQGKIKEIFLFLGISTDLYFIPASSKQRASRSSFHPTSVKRLSAI